MCGCGTMAPFPGEASGDVRAVPPPVATPPMQTGEAVPGPAAPSLSYSSSMREVIDAKEDASSRVADDVHTRKGKLRLREGVQLPMVGEYRWCVLCTACTY